MVRLCGLVVGFVSLMSLAGCNENYRGYGSGYRPSYGGSYNRGYYRGSNERYRDNRGYDRRSNERYRDNRAPQQNTRSPPSNPGNPGGVWDFQRGGGGGGSGRGPGPNFGDPPANHPGN